MCETEAVDLASNLKDFTSPLTVVETHETAVAYIRWFTALHQDVCSKIV